MALISRAALKSIMHLRAKVRYTDMHDLIDSMMHKTEDRSICGLQEYNGRPYLAGECCLRDGVMLQALVPTQGTFNQAHWQMPVSIGNMDTVPEGMTVVVAENYQLGLLDMLTINGVLDSQGLLIIK